MTSQVNLGKIYGSTGGKNNPGDAKFLSGYISEIPTYQSFNFIINSIDSNLAVLAESGVFDWQSDINYKKGTILKHNNVKYFCLKDNINLLPTGIYSSVFWVKAPLYGTSSLIEDGNLGFGLLRCVDQRAGKWDASDITILNTTPTIAFNSPDINQPNWLLQNSNGEFVVTKIGDKTEYPDGRDTISGQGFSYRLFHEGNKPGVNDVIGALNKNPEDGSGYFRRNNLWVRLDIATSRVIKEGRGHALLTREWEENYITAESLYRSELYGEKKWIDDTFLKIADAKSFPSGTEMLFLQNIAPTGWHKDDKNIGRMVHVASQAGSGGTDDPISKNFTHTGSTGWVWYMASNSNRFMRPSNTTTIPSYATPSSQDRATGEPTQWKDRSHLGGVDHSHYINPEQFTPKYVNAITCIKD